MGNCLAHDILWTPSFSTWFCPSCLISFCLFLYCTFIWEHIIKAAFSIALHHYFESISSTASTQEQLSPAPIQSPNSHVASHGRRCSTLLTTIPWLSVNKRQESLFLLNLSYITLSPYHTTRSIHLMLLNCRCQVYLGVITVSASKWLCTFQLLWPLKLHASGIYIHLHLHSIAASKVALWWLQSVLPTFLRYSPKYITELSWFQAPNEFPNMLNHNLHVHMMIASKCISKPAWSQPSSPHTHHYHKCPQAHTITPSKPMSKFTAYLPPSVSWDRLNHGLHYHIIIDSKHISSVTP